MPTRDLRPQPAYPPGRQQEPRAAEQDVRADGRNHAELNSTANDVMTCTHPAAATMRPAEIPALSSDLESYEELAVVGVGALVGHAQKPQLVVPHERLVLKLVLKGRKAGGGG